jgi:hypothetical protein
MTKHGKALPARKPRERSRDDDDSMLLRSAESLGRVIGALQRQLDHATRRLSAAALEPMGGNGRTGHSQSATKKKPGKRPARSRKTAGAGKAASKAAASSKMSPSKSTARRGGARATARRR